MRFLSYGVASPFCLWDISMVIKRNKQQQQQIRIGSDISREGDLPVPTLSCSPTLPIFSFLAQRELRAQALDGETLHSSHPQISMGNRTAQKACGRCRFPYPIPRDADLTGLGESPEICTKCTNLRTSCWRPSGHTW